MSLLMALIRTAGRRTIALAIPAESQLTEPQLFETSMPTSHEYWFTPLAFSVSSGPFLPSKRLSVRKTPLIKAKRRQARSPE